jgi:hypothetical protein
MIAGEPVAMPGTPGIGEPVAMPGAAGIAERAGIELAGPAAVTVAGAAGPADAATADLAGRAAHPGGEQPGNDTAVNTGQQEPDTPVSAPAAPVGDVLP